MSSITWAMTACLNDVFGESWNMGKSPEGRFIFTENLIFQAGCKATGSGKLGLCTETPHFVLWVGGEAASEST